MRDPSAAERAAAEEKRAETSGDFEVAYRAQCRKLGIGRPDPAVVRGAKAGELDINVDRIGATQWDPIVAALAVNKSLKSIHIWSGTVQTLTTAAVSARQNPQLDDSGSTIGPTSSLKSLTGLLKAQKPSSSATRGRGGRSTRGGSSVGSRRTTSTAGSRRKGSGVGLESRTAFALAKALAGCLKHSEEIQTISLPGMTFGAEALRWIGRGLKDNKGSVKTVVLDWCPLGDDGLGHILPGLKESKSLEHLSVAHCRLGDKGGRGVGRLIQAHSVRRAGDVWADSLRGRPVEIGNRGGLTSIDASFNRLNDSATFHLASALRHDNWVTTINFRANQFTDSTVRELLDVFEDNTSLTSIVLAENPGIQDAAAVDALEAALARNSGVEMSQITAVMERRFAQGLAGGTLLNPTAVAGSESEPGDLVSVPVSVPVPIRPEPGASAATLTTALVKEKAARIELESRLRNALAANQELKAKLKTKKAAPRPSTAPARPAPTRTTLARRPPARTTRPASASNVPSSTSRTSAAASTRAQTRPYSMPASRAPAKPAARRPLASKTPAATAAAGTGAKTKAKPKPPVLSSKRGEQEADLLGALETSLASFHKFVDELELQLYMDPTLAQQYKNMGELGPTGDPVTDGIVNKLQTIWDKADADTSAASLDRTSGTDSSMIGSLPATTV